DPVETMARYTLEAAVVGLELNPGFAHRTSKYIEHLFVSIHICRPLLAILFQRLIKDKFGPFWYSLAHMATETGKTVCSNDAMIEWDDAKIHVMSHVVNYASALFEGIR